MNLVVTAATDREEKLAFDELFTDAPALVVNVVRGAYVANLADWMRLLKLCANHRVLTQQWGPALGYAPHWLIATLQRRPALDWRPT